MCKTVFEICTQVKCCWVETTLPVIEEAELVSLEMQKGKPQLNTPISRAKRTMLFFRSINLQTLTIKRLKWVVMLPDMVKLMAPIAFYVTIRST